MKAETITADPEAVALAFADLLRDYPHHAVQLAEAFGRYYRHALVVGTDLVFAATCTTPAPTADDPGAVDVREYVCPALDFLIDTGEQPDAEGVTFAQAVEALSVQHHAPFRG